MARPRLQVDREAVEVGVFDRIPDAASEAGRYLNFGGASLVHAHLAELMIVIVKDGDLVWSLEDLNFQSSRRCTVPVRTCTWRRGLGNARRDCEISPCLFTISAAAGFRIELV